MSNKAELGINVDFTRVKNATDALRKLAEAADKAHAAIAQLQGRGVTLSVVGEKDRHFRGA